ncbi:hypothetical protein MRX96_017011 [Rhipicephalus microplus]|uniref:uncharacterized protein LOC119161312 isoform X2 n=1 Tax=Rhipicephalus microplus TaxID=6941 RepID=UPI003F6CDF4B
MEYVMTNTTEPRGRPSCSRAGRGVNEMGGLSDDNGKMDDHGGHAGRGPSSNTDKFDVWEYVRQIKCAEESEEASAKEVETRKEDTTCLLRARSLSLDSFLGDLELSGIGTATPPPLLYSRRLPLRKKLTADVSGHTASQGLDESTCETDNLFTLSEPCNMGSSQRCDLATYSKEENQRFLDRVLERIPTKALKDGTNDFESFLTGVINTSSPRPQTGGPGSTNIFEQQRRPGLLQTDLSGDMAAKRNHHVTNYTADCMF